MHIDDLSRSLKRRRTKIVATVGPACWDRPTLTQLARAGVDVFRLNMSHGDHATHRRTYGNIRGVAAELGIAVGILADLCGPKIRVGRFAGGSADLVASRIVTVTTRDVLGDGGIIPSTYAGLPGDVRPGDRLLLDDGKLALRVQAVAGSEIECLVVEGGVLRDHKGINLPGVQVSAPSLTEKDRRDAHFAAELGVDFVALSFVRRAADVRALRELLTEAGSVAPIVSKIEKPEALENIEAILDASEAIMIARGDLGVELPPEDVPLAQDELVDLARTRCKPVIVATQMLESMIDQRRPTRAEVSDVSHAVRSGADAVMLSAETAVGVHPLLAVEMMDAVARKTEGHLFQRSAFGTFSVQATPASHARLRDAVANATAQLSRDLGVRAIFALSMTGRTAAIMSAARPAAPLVAVTPDPSTQRQLALQWGVVPMLASEQALRDPRALACHAARALNLAEPGQPVMVVRGFHPDPSRDNPTISVFNV